MLSKTPTGEFRDRIDTASDGLALVYHEDGLTRFAPAGLVAALVTAQH